MSEFLPFSRPSMGDAELAALREVFAIRMDHYRS
ncbi:UDP-4-amino-4-deoxy-L-arabinose--oxoglutarate aminotransferase (plasmid) [Klebsiella aerogenes]|nr:UDP-4-amino-4-deoxy-L-arabinose--oxoglutarate aminotransferase [Klebsiella aerogenes]